MGKLHGVNAMTDVTGFGLLGHLTEMAEGSGTTAEINFGAIPIIDGALEYLAQKVIPGATMRNWKSIGEKVSFQNTSNQLDLIHLLADPQTNGGLLISVSESSVNEVIKILCENGYEDFILPIGRMTAKSDKIIIVR